MRTKVIYLVFMFKKFNISQLFIKLQHKDRAFKPRSAGLLERMLICILSFRKVSRLRQSDSLFKKTEKK